MVADDGLPSIRTPAVDRDMTPPTEGTPTLEPCDCADWKLHATNLFSALPVTRQTEYMPRFAFCPWCGKKRKSAEPEPKTARGHFRSGDLWEYRRLAKDRWQYRQVLNYGQDVWTDLSWTDEVAIAIASLLPENEGMVSVEEARDMALHAIRCALAHPSCNTDSDFPESLGEFLEGAGLPSQFVPHLDLPAAVSVPETEKRDVRSEWNNDPVTFTQRIVNAAHNRKVYFRRGDGSHNGDELSDFAAAIAEVLRGAPTP